MAGNEQRTGRTAAAAAPHGGPKIWAGIVLSGLVLGLVSIPTLELIAVGMAPTVVAWALNREKEPYGPLCVGALNFAGIVPFLPETFGGATTLFAGSGVLVNNFVWFTIYGAAAVGWLIYLALPPIFAAAAIYRAERRVARLRERQRELIVEWGEEVAGGAAPRREGAAEEE